jgi:hypothetical protein
LTAAARAPFRSGWLVFDAAGRHVVDPESRRAAGYQVELELGPDRSPLCVSHSIE